MTNELMERCELLSQNRMTMRKSIRTQNAALSAMGALLATIWGYRIDAEQMSAVQGLIQKNDFVLDEFLPGSREILAIYLAIDSDPEKKLNEIVTVDKKLLANMLPSHHLSLTAQMITHMLPRDEFEHIIERTSVIYKKMRSEFPFIATQNDANAAALLAIYPTPIEQSSLEVERCFNAVKNFSFSSKTIVPMAHVMAMCEAPTEEKLALVKHMFTSLEYAGCSYGDNDYDYAAIASLALTCKAPEETDAVAETVKETYVYLETLLKTRSIFQTDLHKHLRMLLAIMLVNADMVRQLQDKGEDTTDCITRQMCAISCELADEVTAYLGGFM